MSVDGAIFNIGSELAAEISEAIEAAVASEGMEVVEIKSHTQYKKPNLTVLIWRKEGISLDECERAHNAVSGALDKFEDEFDGEYVLNVSSQGLDRKIVTDDDFRRALDTEIEVFEGKKKSVGTLISYDGETVTLTDKAKSIIIERKNITKTQPLIRF